MEKYGLVVEGGGMKCAYSAGILDRFLDEGVTFDYCIGVSAGSANVASYLAGQRGRNLRFYTDHIGEPGYFGAKSYLTTGDLFGLHYIYGTLTNSDGADPLDFPAIVRNPAAYCVVATDARTGKAVYFDKSELVQDDYRHIMASCAMPAVCRPVRIDGVPYYDGGVADAIPVRHAVREGCTRLVVILSKPRGFVKKPEGHRPAYTVLCRRYPQIVRALNRRHRMYRRCQEDLQKLEEKGRALVFAPDDSLKMSTYSMDPGIERQLYDMGVRDFDAMREQLKFFQKNP